MAKKKKEDPLVLDAEGILNECASSLMTAFSYAVEHRDVESILAVSDRWLRLYDMLSELPEKKEPSKLGFLEENNE